MVHLSVTQTSGSLTGYNPWIYDTDSWTTLTTSTYHNSALNWPTVSDASMPTDTVVIWPRATASSHVWYAQSSAWDTDATTATTATTATVPYVLRWRGNGDQGQWEHEDLRPAMKRARQRDKIRQQLYPLTRQRLADAQDFSHVKENEIVALQLIKSMVTPERWRKYLKYGFVEVDGKSGLRYQIIRGRSHVLVYRKGEKIAELCVGLKNRYVMPPTDEVITRMIIVECDEPDIWRRANAHQLKFGTKPQTEEDLAREVLRAA